MIRARYAVGIAGLVGTVLALVVVLAPPAASIQPLALLAEALPTERPGALIAGIGLVVGVAATVLSRAGAGDASPPLVSIPPERVQSTTRTTGRGFDDALDRVDDDDTHFRETIRTTAVETLVQQTGITRQDARTAVSEGTWADDRLAVALVGSPPFPLLSRIRAWLDPVAERRRRARRTIEAIERLDDDTFSTEDDS